MSILHVVLIYNRQRKRGLGKPFSVVSLVLVVGELAARVLGPDPPVLLRYRHPPLGPGLPGLPMAGGPRLRVPPVHRQRLRVRVRRKVHRSFLCF